MYIKSSFMNMHFLKSRYCLLAALPFACSLMFWACGDSSSPAAVGEESSSSVVSSSSALSSAVSSAGVSAESSSAKNVPSSSATQASSESKKMESSAEKIAESSSAVTLSSSAKSEPGSSDSGVCTNCDSYTAADPVLVENGGKGSVTTYGSITAKETSLGGACNYGQTNIQYYAAIHVNVSPGDDKGPWDGGAA